MPAAKQASSRHARYRLLPYVPLSPTTSPHHASEAVAFVDCDDAAPRRNALFHAHALDCNDCNVAQQRMKASRSASVPPRCNGARRLAPRGDAPRYTRQHYASDYFHFAFAFR